MSCKVTSVFLLLTSLAAAAIADPPPQVDVNEVKRWGDRVVISGEGPRDGGDMLFTVAMAPPENDADQWYVTLWGKSDSASLKKLIKLFETDGNLTPFVAAPPRETGKRPWAHFNVYHSDDATQKWRFGDWQIPTDLEHPVVTISPPRNGQWNFRGKYVVVDLIEVKNVDDTASLGKRITASVRAYCKKIEQLGPPPVNSFGYHQQAEPGVGRDSKIPWDVPPVAAPFNPIFTTPTTPAGPVGLTLEEVQAAAPGAPSDFILKTFLAKPASKEAVTLAWMTEQMRLEKENANNTFFFPSSSTVFSVFVGIASLVAGWFARGKMTTGDDSRLRNLEIALRNGGTIRTDPPTTPASLPR